MNINYVQRLLGCVLLLASVDGNASRFLKETDALPLLSFWNFDLGTRYWVGTGKYNVHLADFAQDLVSRITYRDLFHNSAEGFWRLEHQSGLYLKGYIGGGSLPKGLAVDEDFPPFITPYSKTIGSQRHGFLNYLSVDFGYNFLEEPTASLSFFLGYHYWQERFNGFGCQQISGSDICANPPEPLSQNGLDEVPTWHSLRLGIHGSKQLFQPLSLVFDGAYTKSHLSAVNYHNANPAIRGYPETGKGNGAQLDLTLDWQLSNQLNVGLGGRWWYIPTNGFIRFDQTAAAEEAQPVHVSENRYGLILKTNYKFEPTSRVLTQESVDQFKMLWPSIYAGINWGYGTNQNNSSISPTTASAENLTFNYKATPLKLNIQDSGFIAGGQVGYNWYKNFNLIGLEADLDYSQISGSHGSGSEIAEETIITTSMDKKTDWISTTRVRAGRFIWDEILVYITPGIAFGKTKLAFNENQVDIRCAEGTVCTTGDKSKIKAGWSLGGGIEYQISEQLAMKAEYLHLALGNFNLNVFGKNGLGSAINYKLSSNFRFETMRFGINYKLI